MGLTTFQLAIIGLFGFVVVLLASIALIYRMITRKKLVQANAIRAGPRHHVTAFAIGDRDGPAGVSGSGPARTALTAARTALTAARTASMIDLQNGSTMMSHDNAKLASLTRMHRLAKKDAVSEDRRFSRQTIDQQLLALREAPEDGELTLVLSDHAPTPLPTGDPGPETPFRTSPVRPVHGSSLYPESHTEPPNGNWAAAAAAAVQNEEEEDDDDLSDFGGFDVELGELDNPLDSQDISPVRAGAAGISPERAR